MEPAVSTNRDRLECAVWAEDHRSVIDLWWSSPGMAGAVTAQTVKLIFTR